MKILFLTRRFWPEIGGVEKHVLEISKRLVEKRHEVKVIAEDDESFIRRPPAETLRPDASGLRGRGDAFKTTAREWTIRIPVGKNERLKKFQIWWWLWQHRGLIKQAEIVHAHDVGYWWFPFKIIYPRKPFFITFHGYEQYPVPFKNKIMHKLSEKIAKANICVGDYLTKWYGTKADYVTYGGVDVPPRRSASHTIRGETMELVFVGRLDEQTGIMTYLRAFREFEDYKLVIAGNGKLRGEIEDFARENRLRVRVLGEVGEVGELREKARFVFASGYLAILEALAAKKLVFSVYDNPLKEDYLKLGPLAKLVVICGNEIELVKKIKFYLKNPEEEKKMVEKGYEWVKRQTWEKVVKEYLGIWGV